MVAPLRFGSVRPLVRYVDDERAILDTTFTTYSSPDAEPLDHRAVELLVEVDGDDGFHDEGVSKVCTKDGAGSFRVEIVEPQRWWPAGMGEQSLYGLTVRLLVDDRVVDKRTFGVGLTSIRRRRVLGASLPPSLLVNGRIHEVSSVVVVDKVDEHALLPATGESVLLVRDHYGYESLYAAADRAGILMVQSLPIEPDAEIERAVEEQIDRLAQHPSLAGYFVGHLGRARKRVTQAIKALDPTRAVFHDFPLCDAA